MNSLLLGAAFTDITIVTADSHKGQGPGPSLFQCPAAVLPSWHPVVGRGHQVPLSALCCLTGRGHPGLAGTLLAPFSSALACHLPVLVQCWPCRDLANWLGDNRCSVPGQSSEVDWEFSRLWKRKPWQFLETGNRGTSLIQAIVVRSPLAEGRASLSSCGLFPCQRKPCFV